MLINPYKYMNHLNNYVDDKSILKSDINKYKRVIYLIDDRNTKTIDKNNMFSFYNKRNMILINYSESTPFVNVSDYKRYIKSVYIFHTYVDLLSEDKFISQNYTLDYVIVTGYDTGDKSVYNVRLDLGITIVDLTDGMNPWSINLNDLCGNDILLEEKESLFKIDPRYYTPKHYEESTGSEYQSIESIRKRDYFGKDLLDLNTEIFQTFAKDNEYNNYIRKDGGLIPVNNEKSNILFEHLSYIESLPVDIFISAQMSFLSEFILNYDSKYHGINISSVFRPKGFLVDDKIKDDSKLLQNQILKYGQKLSKIFGDLRIMYSFTPFQDVISVIFDNDSDVNKIVIKLDKCSLVERALVQTNKDFYANLLYEYHDVMNHGYNFL
jgi:hypothetical protein